MGYYDDCYDAEHEKQQINKTKQLYQMLEDFRVFRQYDPKRPRRLWSLTGENERLFTRIEDNIKADLFDLRRYLDNLDYS